MAGWHGVASHHPALPAGRGASWRGGRSCGAEGLRSHRCEPRRGRGRAGWYLLGLEHCFPLQLVQRRASSLWSCTNRHKTDAKCCSSHLVALYMLFAFLLWTGVHDCLRSPGPDPGLSMSQGQGSDYPFFSSDVIPSGIHGFHQIKVQKNPTPDPEVSYQRMDSIAKKMNPGMEGDGEGWRDFCRPVVQKTKLWDVFPYPFPDPWQKVSARQWLGASCHEGQASFSVRTS